MADFIKGQAQQKGKRCDKIGFQNFQNFAAGLRFDPTEPRQVI
jgi:hypothetical protein